MLRKTRTRVFLLGAVIAAGAVAAAASSTSGSPSRSELDVLHVGVMTNGAYTDGGYAQSMLHAVNTAMAKVGKSRFTLKTVDRIPYTVQNTNTAKQLLQQNDFVIDFSASGPLFYAGCAAVPDKQCLEVYPVGTPGKNVAGFWNDQTLFYYVEGVAAGKLTKSGTVGFVGALRSNNALAYQNSFALGCQSVRPGCKVRVVYINSFYDPPKAVDAANTLINSGADVLNHFMDDPATLKTASKRNTWAFALYTDQLKIAPKRYVTSLIYEPAAEKVFEFSFRQLLAGKRLPPNSSPPTGTMYGGPAIDFPIAKWGPNVPAAVKAAAAKAYQKISQGKSPYVGPIRDSKGSVRIPKGKTIGVRSKFLYSGWSWPVQGLIGG
jgi:basic membrane protein A